MAKDYIVVLLSMDLDSGLVEHVSADSGAEAYVVALRKLYDESEPEPEAYPFSLEEAARDRPLMAVFAGHLSDMSLEHQVVELEAGAILPIALEVLP